VSTIPSRLHGGMQSIVPAIDSCDGAWYPLHALCGQSIMLTCPNVLHAHWLVPGSSLSLTCWSAVDQTAGWYAHAAEQVQIVVVCSQSSQARHGFCTTVCVPHACINFVAAAAALLLCQPLASMWRQCRTKT
jgi:hypothetical protein